MLTRPVQIALNASQTKLSIRKFSLWDCPIPREELLREHWKKNKKNKKNKDSQLITPPTATETDAQPSTKQKVKDNASGASVSEQSPTRLKI